MANYFPDYVEPEVPEYTPEDVPDRGQGTTPLRPVVPTRQWTKFVTPVQPGKVIDVPIKPPVPLTNDDLTECTLEGAGIFDRLMKASSAHLLEEYSKGRLSGDKYGDILLGSMTAVMQNAVGFLIQRDATFYQAQLIQAQIENLSLEKNKLIYETELTRMQIMKIEADILLTDQQMLLTAEKLVTESGNTLNITTGNIGATQAKMATDNNNALKEGTLLDDKHQEMAANIKTATQNTKTAQRQTQKILAEAELLVQKKVTETGQTTDAVLPILVDGVTVDTGGIQGKQKAIYAAQVTGYTRDAEQKAGKLAIDMYAIELSNKVTQSKFTHSNVGTAVKEAVDNAGLVPTA